MPGPHGPPPPARNPRGVARVAHLLLPAELLEDVGHGRALVGRRTRLLVLARNLVADHRPRGEVVAVVVAGAEGELVGDAAVVRADLLGVEGRVGLWRKGRVGRLPADHLHRVESAEAVPIKLVGLHGARGRADAVHGVRARDALLHPGGALGAGHARVRGHLEGAVGAPALLVGGLRIARAVARRLVAHARVGHGDGAVLPGHPRVLGEAPGAVPPVRVAAVVVPAQARHRVPAVRKRVLVRVLVAPRLALVAVGGLVHVATVVHAPGVDVALVMPHEAVRAVVPAGRHVAHRVALAVVNVRVHAAGRAALVLLVAVAQVPLALGVEARVIADGVADVLGHAARAAEVLGGDAVPAVVEALRGVALHVALHVGQVKVGAPGGALHLEDVRDRGVRHVEDADVVGGLVEPEHRPVEHAGLLRAELGRVAADQHLLHAHAIEDKGGILVALHGLEAEEDVRVAVHGGHGHLERRGGGRHAHAVLDILEELHEAVAHLAELELRHVGAAAGRRGGILGRRGAEEG
mmetsp:Transcript_22841/g.76685  ORF Transcript_22841/g.76685 Transcript_22841/m.76685 type:complete len:523 (-) Transcript_22841:102-1670(-)